VKSKKHRFFVLNSHSLRYFESESAVDQQLPKGVIKLTSVQHTRILSPTLLPPPSSIFSLSSLTPSSSASSSSFSCYSSATTSSSVSSPSTSCSSTLFLPFSSPSLSVDYPFTIETPTRTFTLFASSETERDLWVSTIVKEVFIYSARRSILIDLENSSSPSSSSSSFPSSASSSLVTPPGRRRIKPICSLWTEASPSLLSSSEGSAGLGLLDSSEFTKETLLFEEFANLWKGWFFPKAKTKKEGEREGEEGIEVVVKDFANIPGFSSINFRHSLKVKLLFFLILISFLFCLLTQLFLSISNSSH
jgi:hypothetical protein